MADISVTLTADNLDQVLEEFAEQVDMGLEAIGLQAERHAKENITRNGTIDTGLLRNSITYAVSGQSPNTMNYTAMYGENRHTSGKNKGKRYSAKSKKAGTVKTGSYSGVVGDASEKAVYIGTNVEYAPYVEYGHQQYGGEGHVPAKPFLRPAASQHNEEYKRIMEAALKDEL